MRTLKPAFFTNEALAALDPLARLLFAGLWTIADRAGRLEDRPRRIKAEILPYDDDADVDALLDELAGAGFIRRYEVAGSGRFIWIVTFGKHQRPSSRETPSVIPPIEAVEHDLGDASAESRPAQSIMPFDLGDQPLRPLPDKNAGIWDPGSGERDPGAVAGAGTGTAPAPSAPADEAAVALAELATQWARATGQACTPMHADMLREEMGRGTSPEWIAEAIREASEAGVTKWRYVERILERYRRERPAGGSARDEIRFSYYRQELAERARRKNALPWPEAIAEAEAEVGPYETWLASWLAIGAGGERAS